MSGSPPRVDVRPDVLVVGGGAAGMMAAACAARLGAHVVVVRKGEGATGLSSGAIDIADAWHDWVPGPDAPPWVAGAPYLAALARLAARRPRHPYARIASVDRARIEDAMQRLNELVPALSLTRKPDGTNHVVVTPLGTTKRCAWVPLHASFDFASLPPNASICVADLADLGNFSASRLAETLRWVGALGGHDLDLRIVHVPMAKARQKPFENGMRMALSLDMLEEAEAFGMRIRDALADEALQPSVVLVPAVLGVRNARAVREVVETAIDCPVREILSFPPSAPGARLGLALLEGVEAAGVQVVSGAVHGAEMANMGTSKAHACRRVQRVHARLGNEQIAFEPGAVVLASGRFWSGGLARLGRNEEPIFGLPVVCEGELSNQDFIGALTGDGPEKDHAIFRAGIPYDTNLQPLDNEGACFAENLFAAGSILEGYDPARDGSGLGVCALTGMLAGERAARHRYMQE